MLNMLMALLVAPTVGLEALVAPTLRSLSSPHLRPSELRRAPAWPLRGPPPRFHTTKQDHFDQRNKRTWQQAYYVNDTFFDGSGPVFLCVGGEGPPLDGSAVVSSVHCNIAAEALPKFKALMFAVEHVRRRVQTMPLAPMPFPLTRRAVSADALPAHPPRHVPRSGTMGATTRARARTTRPTSSPSGGCLHGRLSRICARSTSTRATRTACRRARTSGCRLAAPTPACSPAGFV